MGGHYVGDIGKPIRSYNNTDLTNASSAYYRIRKPNGTIMERECSIVSPLGGITFYRTVEGDLDEAGIYYIQTIINYLDGRQLSTDPQVIRIEPRV